MIIRFLLIAMAFLVIIAQSPRAGQTGGQPVLGLLIGVSGLGDQSFNDMTYAGLFKIKQEHDLKLILEDSEKDEDGFRQSMQRLIDKGATIIVANGFYLKELVQQYALRYPDRYFILQDAELPEMSNVASILYSVEEGSFLVGALAGLMTASDHVGFIGGVDIPIMHVFREGFHQGVLHTNHKARIREEFITKAPDFSGFRQPALGYERATAAFSDGVDIIYVAAGLTGNGALQAAKDNNRFAIGVDSDQDHLAEGHVLTSMMKRLDIATYIEVKQIISGNFTPGVKIYGLREQGVDLSPMKFTRHLIPPRFLDRIDAIRQEIISGKIKVPNYLETAAQQSGANR